MVGGTGNPKKLLYETNVAKKSYDYNAMARFLLNCLYLHMFLSFDKDLIEAF